MQLEVVELLDDLLARLAREELGVLDDRRVDLLEAEAARDLAEVAEEPRPQAQVLGIEVARAARRLEVGAGSGASVTTGASRPGCAQRG